MEYHVKKEDEILFTGTLDQCWLYLIRNFNDKTVNELVGSNIRIES